MEIETNCKHDSLNKLNVSEEGMTQRNTEENTDEKTIEIQLANCETSRPIRRLDFKNNKSGQTATKGEKPANNDKKQRDMDGNEKDRQKKSRSVSALVKKTVCRYTSKQQKNTEN